MCNKIANTTAKKLIATYMSKWKKKIREECLLPFIWNTLERYQCKICMNCLKVNIPKTKAEKHVIF